MYRIMLVTSKRSNYESLYKYLTVNVDGVVSPAEYETKEALDKKVETMLNEDGYSKNDFIIIEELDYNVESDIYENTDSSSTSETDMTNYYTKDEVDALLEKISSGSSTTDSGTESSADTKTATE